jgi:hypothetical protein
MEVRLYTSHVSVNASHHVLMFCVIDKQRHMVAQSKVLAKAALSYTMA